MYNSDSIIITENSQAIRFNKNSTLYTTLNLSFQVIRNQTKIDQNKDCDTISEYSVLHKFVESYTNIICDKLNEQILI